MIYIIGDSHSRAFSLNKNFLPLFIGAGKEHCFISDDTLLVLKKSIQNTLKHIPNDSHILLVLGEPDTRYYLGKGWTPWEVDGIDDVSQVEFKISQSAYRYESLIHWLVSNFKHKLHIFNITPSERMNQNVYVKEFNKQLKSICISNNINFIDLTDYLFIDNNKIDKKYLADQVHLNNMIQPIVENIFIKKGLIEEKTFNQEIEFDPIEIQDNFVYNAKFSCYVYDPSQKNKTKNIKAILVKFFHKWKSKND